MIRTFICVELPEADRERLGALQARLRPHGARVSWPQPGNIHLTLAFLGDVDDGAVDAVGRAAHEVSSQSAPFELTISGAGGFPSLERPRVLWAGVGGDLAALGALHASLVGALRPLGFAPDDKPFSPHLTIGRVKDPRDPSLRPLVAALKTASLTGSPFAVNEIVVMRSDLDSRGARHTPLAHCPLGDRPL